MNAMFRHTLKRLQGQIIGWGVALAVLAFIIASLFHTVTQMRDQLGQLINSLPRELLAFVGNIDRMFSPAGFLDARYFSLMPLILGVFAVIIGSGLIASDEEVDRKLNEIKSPYTAEQFDARLKEKKITIDDFKRDLKRSLTRDKVLNKEITSRIAVTDQDVSDYYNAHKSEFNLIEPQYHISQIFVTTQPNAQVHNLRNDKAQNEADARKKIQMITNRVESGDDFATLAMNYSEDPETSANGGDLGFTPESSLKNTDPLTRDAVMKLKPGQYSPVIVLANPASRQVFGFRIVKLIAKEPAGQRDLNDPRVQQAIRQQMRDRREQLLKAAYYEVLRNEAKVNNYFADDVLNNAGSEKK